MRCLGRTSAAIPSGIARIRRAAGCPKPGYVNRDGLVLRWRRGFTLIELMVTLAVFAILSLLAMPSFNTWIANNRVRAVAEDMANGLRLAQAEALRRSRQTVFALTGPNPSADATGAPNYAALADGSTWAVSVAQSTMEPTGLFVRGGAIADIGPGVTVTGPTVVCFGPQGFLVANDNSTPSAGTGVGAVCRPPAADATPPALIYQIKSTSGAGDHPLQIEVGLGGQVRLCNPAQSLNGTTPGASEGCQYRPSSS
jgi:type IV fimbrial biogenesis protein FimT